MRASRSLRAASAGLLAGISAGLLILSGLGSGTAQAQYAYEPDVLLPPRAIVWRLNDRGFTEITRPRFDGQAYVVEASNPFGDRVRLFLDAHDGRIVGRQRLDAPVERPGRLVRRGAPGYGWTEEDEAPRRPIREAERLIPPADIPIPQSLPRRSRPILAERPEFAVRPDAALRPAPPPVAEPDDRNPMGLNPDARPAETRPKVESPRKVVRLNPPPKATVPAASPEAQKLSDVPPAPAKIEANPGAASAAIAPPPVKATTMTPASVQPPPAEKPAAQSWKDVPAEARRPVRVIGGATLVPGTTSKTAE